MSSRLQVTFAISVCLLVMVLWRVIPHPVVVVAVGLLPFAVLFVLDKPFVMVVLFVVFSFFRIHEVFPQLYSLKIPLLLSLASIATLFWHVAITRKIELYWRIEFTWLTLFFVLVTIGVIMASNRPVAIAYFSAIYWKIALITFAIAWLSRSISDFAFAARIITVAGLMVGLVALYNKANGIGLVEGTRVTIGRSFGSVLGDPNDLALVLMFPTSFAVSLFLTRGLKYWERTLGLVCVPALFSAVIATQSRGGLLGILAIFGVYGYRRIHSKILFFGLGVVGAVVLYLAAGISGRASGGAAEEGVDASAMGRIYAWEAAIGMAVDNPFTGVGIDNFFPNYFFYSKHWDGLNHAVHSTWFGVLAETGFLGLVIFIGIIVRLLKTTLQTLYRIEHYSDPVHPAITATAEAVLAGLVATLVSGTFLTQGFTWPLYILAALVIAVARWTDLYLADSSEITKDKTTMKGLGE